MTKTPLILGTTLLFIAVSITAAAQPTLIANHQPMPEPPMLWLQIYNQGLPAKAMYTEQTSDGGFIMTGTSMTGTCPSGDILFLMKTDAAGILSWRNTYTPDGTNTHGYVVHQTNDGGYIVVGNKGYTYHYDAFVLKVDSNGNVTWQDSFGTYEKFEEGKDVIQTADGGYIVLALSGAQGGDVWLIKLAADGTEQWNTTYGGSDFDTPSSFIQTADGGYLLIGETTTSDGSPDVWAVKTNASGIEQWNKAYGAQGLPEEGISVKASTDSYAILANSYDYNWTGSLWLLSISLNGTLQWDQHYSSANGSLVGTSLSTTYGGGYFITANNNEASYNYFPDIYLLKTSPLGQTTWTKYYDFSQGNTDVSNHGLQAADGSYYVTGYTGNDSNFTYYPYLLKIGSDRSIELSSVSARLGVTAHLKNYGADDGTADVSITVNGGLLNHVNTSLTQRVTVPAGGEASVSCKPFLGLGPIHIAVNVNGATYRYEGKQLFFLSLLLS